jgi:hypothetical protein
MDISSLQIEWFTHTAATIHTYGHLVTTVGTGRCWVPGCTCPPSRRPWAYTIGLCQADQPELLAFGLGEQKAYSLLNWVAGEHSAGRRLPVGREHQLVFQGTPVRLVPVPESCVDPTQDVMAGWHGYYSHFGSYTMPAVLQVVHADRAGRFPWQTDYDRNLRYGQPVLEDDPKALRVQLSPVWPTRRTNAAKPRPGRRRR